MSEVKKREIGPDGAMTLRAVELAGIGVSVLCGGIGHRIRAARACRVAVE